MRGTHFPHNGSEVILTCWTISAPCGRTGTCPRPIWRGCFISTRPPNSDYELGNLNIPIPVLKELALYFDTSVDYLLGLTNHPTPYPRA